MENEKSITELIYIFGALLLVGSKAIGLEERSWPFVLLFIAGSILIMIKMCFETYTVSELVFFGLLIGYAIFTFFHTGSTGLLSLEILLVGMKNVEIKRLFRWLSVEYALCFLVTIVLSIFGNRDGVELVHEKFGMVMLRQSLGYTHPNVLHVTYVVLMALVLYVTVIYGKHGKALWKIILILLAGDIFIFVFSLSNTGMLMSLVLFAMVVWADMIHNKSGKSLSLNKMEKGLIYAWIPVSFFGFIILSRIVTLNNNWYTKANDVFNMRTWCINRYFEDEGITLFGRELSLQGVSLDNSYAYSLFSYGIVFILVALLAYLFTCRYLMNHNRIIDLAILIALTFGGITEQFMFNASIKNITIFMVGEWLFDSKFLERVREIRLFGLNREIRLLKQPCTIRMIIPDIFHSVWVKRSAWIITSFIMIILSISFFVSGADYDVVYASPYSVDVQMEDYDIREMTNDPDTENLRPYYIGNVEENNCDRVYIFNDSNSVIVKQMRIDHLLAIVFFMMLWIGFAVRFYTRGRRYEGTDR